MLSAILFCIVLASVILKTEQQCPDSGYSIDGQILSNLQRFITALALNAKEIGLDINLTKTECMTTAKDQPRLNITINGKPIKQVTEFVYLGFKLSCKNDPEVTVRHRIDLGW